MERMTICQLYEPMRNILFPIVWTTKFLELNQEDAGRLIRAFCKHITGGHQELTEFDETAENNKYLLEIFHTMTESADHNALKFNMRKKPLTEDIIPEHLIKWFKVESYD